MAKEKAGINTYAKHVCWRRRDRGIGQMFFILSVGYTWVLRGRGDHWSPAKNHEVTLLIVFFSLVRKERKGQKEECFPLLNTFCRLAATGANKVPRPSRYSIAMATCSKRPSADSDSLLCHVRLRRTSRFDFGCWCGEVPVLTG